MASANCSVGRELADPIALMPRDLWATHRGAHMPQLLMIVRPLQQTVIASTAGGTMACYLGGARRLSAEERALLARCRRARELA